MLELAVKMIATAVVVIGVALAVARLGPRLGGVVAGTPIILGPGFFFLGLEQTPEFLTSAAVSSLHALTATLAFLIAYVLVAGRLGAVASVATAILAWLVFALGFSLLPGSWGIALAAYGAVYAVALMIQRRLRLPQARARAPVRWMDLLVRGGVAGILVGVATTVGAAAGPAVSGTLVGFPVGFTVISLTLHQRFGAPVARATLAAAQSGMASLVAFAAAEAIAAPLLGGMGAFWVALGSSLLFSTVLFVASHYLGQRADRRARGCPEEV